MKKGSISKKYFSFLLTLFVISVLLFAGPIKATGSVILDLFDNPEPVTGETIKTNATITWGIDNLPNLDMAPINITFNNETRCSFDAYTREEIDGCEGITIDGYYENNTIFGYGYYNGGITFYYNISIDTSSENNFSIGKEYSMKLVTMIGNSTPVSFTPKAQPPPPSDPPPPAPAPGGGGGGGGAPPPSDDDGFERATQIYTNIQPGETINLTLTKNNDELLTLTITFNETIPTITLRMMRHGTDAPTPTLPQGITYEYIEITSEDLAPGSIDGNIKLKFPIPKAWMNANNILPGDITMARYTNNEWIELRTTHETETPEKHYFVAETTGFSYFAITGTPTPVEEEETTEEPVEREPSQESVEEIGPIGGVITNHTEQQEKTKGSLAWLWITITIIILGSSAFYFTNDYQQKKREEFDQRVNRLAEEYRAEHKSERQEKKKPSNEGKKTAKKQRKKHRHK